MVTDLLHNFSPMRAMHKSYFSSGSVLILCSFQTRRQEAEAAVVRQSSRVLPLPLHRRATPSAASPQSSQTTSSRTAPDAGKCTSSVNFNILLPVVTFVHLFQNSGLRVAYVHKLMYQMKYGHDRNLGRSRTGSVIIRACDLR